jgi:hypothetical protein
MTSAFYDAVRETVFGGSLSQPQVDGINAIITAWVREGDGDDYKLAYLLGTAFHETARTMQPVRETLATTDAKAKERLTKAWKSGKLKVKADYWSGGWFGRGYVQLTHKANYERASKELGIDMVKDPSKAMIPEVAALILVRGCLEGWFTSRKLGAYITKSDADYINARRVVNGLDRAEDIAKYSTSFYRALAEAKEAPKPSAAPTAPPKPVPATADVPRPSIGLTGAGWIAIIIAFFVTSIIGAWNAVVEITGYVSPWW